MNLEQLLSDQHSGQKFNTEFKIKDDQLVTEKISVFDQATNSEKSNLSDQKADKPKCETKTEIDDSFEIFLPLKTKSNSNSAIKKSTSFSSPSKSKKKNTNSSNRICPYFFARKPTSTKEDKDLQLALARSLADVSPGEKDVLKRAVNNRKLSKQNSDFLKTLTSKSKRPGKNTLLFRRTKEERQNILTQKVAIVLLDKEDIEDKSFERQEVELLSCHLVETWDRESTLWERSKREVFDSAEFYVACLEKFMEQPSATASVASSSNSFEGPPGESI